MPSEVISEPMSQLSGEIVDVTTEDPGEDARAVDEWVPSAEGRLGYRLDEITSRRALPPSPLQDRIDEMKSRWSGVSDIEFGVWADVVAEDDRAAEQASAEVWPTD
jgi:hypothetical protein